MKNLKIEAKIIVCNENTLNDIEKKLINIAKDASIKAYSPYSGFNVGCAVLLENGEIFSGNNQENAAYPSGLCAERIALMYANANYPDAAISMISIVAQKNGAFSQHPVSPCGACRQVILEAENRFQKSIRLLLAGEKETYIIYSIKDILPLSFDKSNLEK